ncbi:MAG: asparaginase [Firmicutes bacterium]|nr:asparaginase [Bacillota bacterium]
MSTDFKKLFLFIVTSLFTICLTGCAKPIQEAHVEAPCTPSPYVQEKLPEITQKGTVVILATGGTIAGSGNAGEETGYISGVLSIEDLISAVPQIEDCANIEAIQICNINSDDITSQIWIELANTINELSANPNIDGFVITHGTDTLEETAYFLNLTVKTDKPVVLTGSMRPATALSADGAMNLYQSVCVAASEASRGKGVLVVFSDMIFSARSVEKVSTYQVTAISADETGCIGIVRNQEVYYYETPVKRHTTDSEFSVSDLESLPKVSIVYFSVDADPGLLTYAAEHSEGIVIAGAGAGEFSQEFIEVINQLNIPVIISSRTNTGLITQDSVLCENTVAANTLSPSKAAVLLRLALTTNWDHETLLRMYSEY